MKYTNLKINFKVVVFLYKKNIFQKWARVGVGGKENRVLCARIYNKFTKIKCQILPTPPGKILYSPLRLGKPPAQRDNFGNHAFPPPTNHGPAYSHVTTARYSKVRNP